MSEKRLPSEHHADVVGFLEKARHVTRGAQPARVVFALDATASREPAWDTACHVQNEMFLAAESGNKLAVQLVFYRGFGECRASKWVTDPRALIKLMTAVRCQAGQTQINRVLLHGLREVERHRVHAIVFVGDAVEEDIDLLGATAGKLALRGTKLFLFQEGENPTATRAFRHLARATRGAHCQFISSAPDQLRELLAAVAAYANGGINAVSKLATKRGGMVRQIEQQLR